MGLPAPDGLHFPRPTLAPAPSPSPYKECVSLTALDSLRSGEGSPSHLPVQIPRVLSGRGRDRGRGPELESGASEKPHAVQPLGFTGPLFCLFSPCVQWDHT